MTCVIGGILVLSGPFWEPYVRALLSNRLDVEVDPPTAPIFGAALVIAGLIYHVIVSYLELTQKRFDFDVKKEDARRNRNHDLQIYEKFINAFPDEKVKSILGFIDTNHLFMRSQMNMLDDLEYYLASTDNEFLNPTVSQEANSLIDALREWRNFCSLRFFTHGPPGDDMAFALQPNWNIDRGGDYDPEKMRKYDELSDDLHKKTNALLMQFDEFRRAAKREVM